MDHSEVIELMTDFFDATSRLIKRNSRMQIKILNRFAKPKKALEKTTGYRDELRNTINSDAVVV